MMVVQHNLESMFANRQLNITTGNKTKSTEKLSSGFRINRAADDAAGLSISEKMRWQIRGLDKASNNIMDGVSFVQTAEGALNEVHSMLSRMKELCVQAANDSNTKEDRMAIQNELDALKEEHERIFDDTTFNTLPVFRKKLNYVEYEDNTQQVVVGTGTEYVEGNQYGLVSVMNQNGNQNITTADHLANRVTMTGNNWVTSGNYEPERIENSWAYTENGEKTTHHEETNANQNIIFATDFGTVAEGDTWTDGFDTFTRHGNLLTAIRDYLPTGIYDKEGNEVPTSDGYYYNEIVLYDSGEGHAYATETRSKIYQKSTGDELGGQVCKIWDSSGCGGTYRKEGTYACAYMDFSKLGTDFHKEDLYNLGFASTCSHGCNVHYSMQFVDNSDGSLNLDKTANGLSYGEKNGSSKLIQLDISTISDDAEGGAKLVKAIVEAAKQSTSFDNHWEQYAYNTSEPAKLYLYENTIYVKSGERSTWEPAARDENGVQTNLTYTMGAKKYVEEEDLHIQSSALAYQAIIIQRPVMTNEDLGINSVFVDDFETATQSIALVDQATDYVSEKRAYLGAMQNRLEHAYAIDQNTSENTQSAESRLRDTDMAKEMVSYSRHSILEQAGQAMLSQANQNRQGIMTLLG